MLTAFWEFRRETLELWLQEWFLDHRVGLKTYIGQFTWQHALYELASEMEFINDRLRDFNTIDEALPVLAETSLRGERLNPYKPLSEQVYAWQTGRGG